jgi:hypothetical protein
MFKKKNTTLVVISLLFLYSSQIGASQPINFEFGHLARQAAQEENDYYL